MPGYNDVSEPLYAASRQSTIKLSKELSRTFDKLKKRLLERPIVWLPNIYRDFILETNASTIAVGADLKQMFSDTKLGHPIAFFQSIVDIK